MKLVEFPEAKRRIQRNGDRAGIQHAEEALDELWGGRQHECDTVALAYSAPNQVRGNKPRLLAYAGEGDILVLLFAVHKNQTNIGLCCRV